jgi:hypothetical protein
MWRARSGSPGRGASRPLREYAHDENSHAEPDPISNDLFGVMTWERKHGFDYILFDCDGDLVEDLPSHDW